MRRISIVIALITALAGASIAMPAVAQARGRHHHRSSASRHHRRSHSRKRCGHHRIRKVRHIKRRRHGHVVKLRKVVCVRAHTKRKHTQHKTTSQTAPAAPTQSAPAPVAAPTPPAPSTSPTKSPETTTPKPPSEPTPEKAPEPSGPLSTTTALSVGPEEDCVIESPGGVGTVNACLYKISASVTSSSGVVNTPTPIFVLTNPAEPAEGWTVSGVDALTVRISVERVGSVVATSVVIPGVEPIASVSGEAPWSIYASYSGSSEYLASKSTTQLIN